MKYFGHGLSEQHKELNSIIRKSSRPNAPKTCSCRYMQSCTLLWYLIQTETRWIIFYVI